MRTAKITRDTTETQINLTVNLDGSGTGQIDSAVPFLDHMLTLLARHGAFDLSLQARGDIDIDAHHTVEDVGICLGQALSRALGDKAGITRYGHALVPMDEALVQVAVDLSGRSHLSFQVDLPTARVGNFDTELVEEFMRALVNNAGLTLHVNMLAGKNTHHIIEAIFKALGRALRAAWTKDPRATGIPSTKGVL